jgi:hypothetical protein
MDEENQQLETSTETGTETAQTDDNAEVRTEGAEQVQESSDWRVKKYGENYNDNVEYHRDTTNYLRKELDKAKAQARQSRRGIEHDDDAGTQRRPAANGRSDDDAPQRFEGETTEEFEKYLQQRMMKTFESTLEQRERDNTFRQSLARAREMERGDSENGIPSFAEIEDSHLQPLIQQTRTERDILIPKGSSIVRELLRHLPDPGQSAYTLGVLLRAGNSDGLRKMFAGQGREEFAKKINEVSKAAATSKNGSSGRTTGKLTPEDIDNMSSAEFEKLKAKNTGRAA